MDSRRPLPLDAARAWPRWGVALLLAAVLALGGCATPLRIENDVTSHATWGEGSTPRAGETYAFERLPSQREGVAAQEQQRWENLARPLLEAQGLQPATDAWPARWAILIQARSVRLSRSPWDDPRERWPRWGVMGGIGHRPSVFGSIQFNLSPPYYQRELTLTVRDRRSGETVFESRAYHDGPWADSDGLWNALLQAALKDFPRPPAGQRRVVIEVAP